MIYLKCSKDLDSNKDSTASINTINTRRRLDGETSNKKGGKHGKSNNTSKRQ